MTQCCLCSRRLRQLWPSFGGLSLENVPNIDVPFSSLPSSSTPKERNEYITLDRLIRYGPSSGCKACEKVGGAHTAACKARFNALIRADKLAVEGKQKAHSLSDAPFPTSPVPVLPPIPSGDASANEPGEVVDPSSLPFSAGIKPGEGRVSQAVELSQKISCMSMHAQRIPS